MDNIEKIKYINNLIDIEIKISNDYGLYIEEEHIKREKDFFIEIFIKNWDDIKNSNKYMILKNYIFDKTYEKLDDLNKYYWEKLKYDNVRNKYQCHISNLINNIFLHIDYV